jgi:hypothetical protein
MKSKINSRLKRQHVFGTKQIFRFLLACVTICGYNNLQSQNALVPFNFTLNTASTTSAGIFTKDSILVRTLWSNVKFASGTHTKYWDRKDDNGFLVKDTSFVVRVLSNNVTYNWDGACIGNTSDSMIGASKHRYFARPNSMAIFGNFAYYSTGYAEGIPSCYKFNLQKPQNKIGILMPDWASTDQESDFTATDGSNVYWAGFDPFNTAQCFVYATKVSNDQETTFSNGGSISTTYGRTYSSAIDAYTNNKLGRASGMAVQKNGNYLFVAHASLNELHVINKTTGALVQNLAVTNARQLCVDMNDKLWMISGTNTVQKFTVNSNGTLSSPTLSISNLIEPLALSVSPNNYIVAISDGGSSQQVKAFNNTTGALVWTLGQSGGFSSDPLVSNDKFMFSHVATELKGSFIAFQADSSFWVGDPGNERIQHYTASRTFINCIASLPHSYSVEADKNNPTRVFNEYLEYKIDYSKTLAPNNGSWVLLRNWRAGVKSNYYEDFKSDVLRNVITLSNGRTYAIIKNRSNPNWPIPEVVELPATGHLRYTGVVFNSFENFMIDNNGTARTLIADGNVGKVGYWESRTLTGFNNANNPIWSSPSTIASTPQGAIEDPLTDANAFPSKTTSDMLICFNPWDIKNNGKGTGYHLGAIKKGTNKWRWLASKSTLVDYKGPMPTDGTFDQGNGVVYPGGNAYAIDNNIFWNYHGEFWKNSQTNIWNQYNEDGLMIGQFGITSIDGEAYNTEAFAMGAGNVFSSSIVKVGSDYYIYHNDESVHAGIHRWKISGLSTIAEQSSNITIQNVNGGLMGAYFDGNKLNNLKFKTAVVNTTVNMTTPPTQISNKSDFSCRWTGFVVPAYSQSYTFYTKTSKGARLWVNGNLIIDQWSNSSLTQYSSSTIALIAGKRYRIKIEINGGTADLLWSCSSQTIQIIPSNCLMPSEAPDYSTSIDLLEGLNHGNILENELYGWSRNPTNEININWENFWNVKIGIRSQTKEKPDLLARFCKDSVNYTVSRDLVLPNTCLNSYKLKGVMNLDENFPVITNEVGGLYIDLVDNTGKIIARITHEMIYQGTTNPSSIKINGRSVVTRSNGILNTIIHKNQAFILDVNSSGMITFTYGDFAPVTVAPFNNTSKWSQPTAFKLNYVSRQGTNYGQCISLIALSFEPKFNVAEITTPSTKICQGQSTTLIANSGSSYLWSNSSTAKSMSVNSTGTYSVRVTDANGCQSTSKEVNVTVNQKPTAQITANGPLAICQGSSIILSSNDAKTYQWSNNANTKTISVSNGGTYSLIITDSNGCVSSSTQKAVVVNTNPIIKLTANGPLRFCQGKSVNISTTFSGSYLWSNSSRTQSVNANASGIYFVTGTDTNGCFANSDSLVVDVTILPQQKINSSNKTTFCTGSFVDLSSSFVGTYQWNNASSNAKLRASQTGSFSFIGTDANGCQVKSDTIKVTVNPSPSETIINSGPLSFCDGDSVELTAASGLSYLWNTFDTTQSINVKSSGTYFAELSNQYKCNGLSNSADVLVNRTPDPSISVNYTVLTSSETNGNQWYFNGSPIQNATAQSYQAISIGSYYVESSNGTCTGISQSVSISSLSLNKQINNELFTLFPNPTSGILIFENNLNKTYRLKIYNMYGQMLYSIDGLDHLELNLAEFEAGSYLVKIEIENQLFTQNIIKT